MRPSPKTRGRFVLPAPADADARAAETAPAAPRRAIFATLGLALCAACGPSLPPAPSPPAEPGWERVVHQIPVTGEDGRPFDHPFLGGFNLPRPQLADADGDGDADLFLQEASDRVMYFENTGGAEGGRFRWVTDWLGRRSVGEWYRLADLDLDGDLDLLAESPFSYIRYYRNDGGPPESAFVLAADTLRDVNGQPIFSDRQNIPNAADIDCNDRVDLLIGRLTGTITRYEAVETAPGDVPRFAHVTDSFQDIEIVAALQGDDSKHGANTMALGDVDADGDPDLFWGDFFEAGLLFIENTGTCAHPSLRGAPRPFPHGDPVRTSGYNAPALGDVDMDGDLDLVMGVLGGAFNPNATSVENLHLFTQQDGGFAHATSRLIRTLDVGSESWPALADVDGDGDLDMLVSNKIEPGDAATGRLFLFENTGRPSAPAFAARGPVPGLPSGYHYAPAFGDLDADGDLDMLLGTWQDRIAYFRNDAAARPGSGAEAALAGLVLADSAIVTLTRGRNATPTLADLDADGDLDLLIGEASGTLNYYRNEGGPRAPVFALVSDEFQDIDPGRRSVPALLDLDVDGDLDLVVGAESGGLHVYVNEGSRSAPAFVAGGLLGPATPGFAAPAFGDLDADGDADLAAGSVGGGLFLYLGTGGEAPGSGR